MSETLASVDLEHDLRQTVGVVLIKPDAIENDLTQIIIDNIYSKLQKDVPDIEVEDVVVMDSLEPQEVKDIYPDLDQTYLRAHQDFFEKGPLVAVFFSSDGSKKDIWDLLTKARGKIGEGSGLEDSIRGILPLPGERDRFNELSGKLKTGQTVDSDYAEIIRNLAHVPDNMREFAGLARAVDKREPVKILKQKFGSDYSKIWDRLA